MFHYFRYFGFHVNDVPPLMMIIDYFNFVGIAILQSKTNPKLVIDSYTELTYHISFYVKNLMSSNPYHPWHTSLHVLRCNTRVPDNVASEIKEYLRESTEIIAPVAVNLPRLKDKDNLPVIGTAAAALSKYLITGDQELLHVKSFRKTIILSPRAFWKKMKK